MKDEDKDSARYAKLYYAIVDVIESPKRKGSTEEALSIVTWVEQEILKERSKTLLWAMELIKTEYNKSDDFPTIRIINQIAKEAISNELKILRSEVSRLKEEIIDEGKR